MAQQTELRPLSPSLGDLFDAWWAPFRFLLRMGVKFAIPVVPGLFIFDSIGKVSESSSTVFATTAAELMIAPWEAMFEAGAVIFLPMTLFVMYSTLKIVRTKA